MGTTIAISDENHWLLRRFKEGSQAKSMNEAIRMLLDGGNHTVWHLLRAHHDNVQEVVQKWRLTNLTAFGSRVKGNAHANSDLDLVADVKKEISLLELQEIQEDLAEAFGVPVDFHTWNSLKPRLRDRIEEYGVQIHA